MNKNSNKKTESVSIENDFPLDIFHVSFQKIVKQTNICLTFPVDFIASTMMLAVSTAIGNKAKVYLDYPIQLNMFLVIVAGRGKNKSAPTKWALKPLNRLDQESYQEFLNTQDCEDCKESPFEQFVVSDITIEAMKGILVNQPKGLLFYRDELGGILENLNRYNSGNDIPFLLEAFNGSAIRVNRRKGHPLYKENPFLSILGTTQPDVFQKLISKLVKNGLLDRFLIVSKHRLLKPHKSRLKLDPEIYQSWEKLIQNFANFKRSKTYQLNHEAQEFYYDWHKGMTNKCNEVNNEILNGIYAKLEVYMLKFSLILQLIDDYFNNKKTTEVRIEAMKGAKKLTTYFYRNAYRFHIEGKRLQVWESLNGDKKAFYELMPDGKFTTWQAKQFVKDSEKLNVHDRTIDRYLSDKALFENLGNGKWKKINLCRS